MSRTTAPIQAREFTEVTGTWPNLRFKVDVRHLITEAKQPLVNFSTEKQQRLLIEPLYSSWRPVPPRKRQRRLPFLAAANVGLFPSVHEQASAPNVFLSLDVSVPADWHAKAGRSYFFWEFGKSPDVVIEIISHRRRGEVARQQKKYARCGIPYYAVYDPTQQLREQTLQLFELCGTAYVQRTQHWLSYIGLGLTLWQGVYEDKQATWLRWCDAQGRVLPTGAERADQEAARNRVLAAKLRELGVDPDQL